MGRWPIGLTAAELPLVASAPSLIVSSLAEVVVMDFRVLGPVEVWDCAQRLELGGVKTAYAPCGAAPERQPAGLHRPSRRPAVGRGAAVDREKRGPDLRVAAAPGAAPPSRPKRIGVGAGDPDRRDTCCGSSRASWTWTASRN